ncbi:MULTISPECIES: B12-binding domain-containing radical SAM protein [Dyella]|uniref:B12-binding domain-containing radical SAM protein n=2 Tax=Dyella TaxID=231454 RepID=A0A4R0YWL9_9GAMM|nr:MULTISPECIES: radical SAM protein [Dyella]TBR39464.1 B12-binding domain-containing radical SAM protein [Dyella terrae]TCI12951.1 B12-binding domain-containing radical SAM protein [Dyella soli]
MSDRPRTLLINPTVTSRHSARFPLALLHLAAGLDVKGSCKIVDCNVDRDMPGAVRAAFDGDRFDAVGLGVMGGPQVATAIQASRLVRELDPRVPIVWGSYFPTLYPDTALAAPYVDYAVRGQGDVALPELVQALHQGRHDRIAQIEGLSWKSREGIVHNRARKIVRSDPTGLLPYHLLGDPRKYLAHTYLGRRTVAHQASIGCRFRCTFCGVAAMFGGATALPDAMRLRRDLNYLKYDLGADSVQYFDHNFFDREQDMVPLLEVMAEMALPWWCFARADALLNLSESTWKLVRKSRLRMAYIGAESASPAMLREIRKGTRPDQTLAVAELCRRHGVIPEMSFMVAPPVNTEEETEHTFEFVRELKRINPHSEVVIYIYTPLPDSSRNERDRERHPSAPLLDADGHPMVFPATPEVWTEKRWVDYACHTDAPWLTDRLRRRIRDFETVLRCRFPTVQDMRSPRWVKRTLSAAATWRYHARRYDGPWELNLANRIVRLRMPQVSGL